VLHADDDDATRSTSPALLDALKPARGAFPHLYVCGPKA